MWAEQLPEGSNKKEAFFHIIRQWAEADPTAAATWLEGLPPSPERTRALGTMAGTLTRIQGIQAAIDWIGTLPDGDPGLGEAADCITSSYNADEEEQKLLKWIHYHPIADKIKGFPFLSQRGAGC